MPTLQVPLPPQLWQRLQAYRRARGEKLGIPVVDLQIAIVKLLERGLDESSDISDPLLLTEACHETAAEGSDLVPGSQGTSHRCQLRGPHRTQPPLRV